MEIQYPRLTLLRGRSTDQGTPGILFRANGTRLCYTLELPWRGNVRQRSCVPPEPDTLPPQQYLCRMVRSPKFGPVYHVLDVPGRDAILIHGANLAGDVDKGYKTHLQGCIAPGLEFGRINGQFAILNSTPARTMLQTEMRGEPFMLEIMPWTSGQF